MMCISETEKTLIVTILNKFNHISLGVEGTKFQHSVEKLAANIYGYHFVARERFRAQSLRCIGLMKILIVPADCFHEDDCPTNVVSLTIIFCIVLFSQPCKECQNYPKFPLDLPCILPSLIIVLIFGT